MQMMSNFMAPPQQNNGYGQPPPNPLGEFDG